MKAAALILGVIVATGCALDSRPHVGDSSAAQRHVWAPDPPPTRDDGPSDAAREPAPHTSSAVDAGQRTAPASLDAGPRARTTDMDVDANTEPPPGVASAPMPDASTAAMHPLEGCSRDELRERADAYLAAMGMGDASALVVHPSARYTENGQDELLGRGLWLSRPQTKFARHVLDEDACSSVTEAVLTQTLSSIVFGVRLRYVAKQLIDIEAQVVPPNVAYYNPMGVIPDGVDTWIAPVPADMRMTADALRLVAENYFDSTTDSKLLPPSAATCMVLQNGAQASVDGSCKRVPEGGARFEQVRLPVVDATAGIVTAIVVRKAFVGLMLFKVQAGMIQNIDVIGGAATPSSGW